MNLFIDTNILLAFYHFSSDDLEEVRKLAVLLTQRKVRLFLPQQVKEEFYRNRESKIADALKRLKAQRPNSQFPQLCQGYKEYGLLRKLLTKYKKTHGELLEQLEKDVETKNLKADDTIRQLFEKAKAIPADEELIARARNRIDTGNPPGNQGSLGDAINWETLLETVPEGESLFFVTDDHKDFGSPLSAGAFSGFLLEEWVARKQSELFYYERLSQFFADQFPDIELASELEKDLLIDDLAKSDSFAATHITVAKLRRFTEFSAPQLSEIVRAAIYNPQIYKIVGDHDVSSFLRNVVSGREELINDELLEELNRLLEFA